MKRKITLVGDLTCDIVISGLTSMPEWGQEAEIEQPVIRMGGNIGNMVIGAHALGSDIAVVATVGEDNDGLELKTYLQEYGISTKYIITSKENGTSRTYACVRKDGERLMLTYPGVLNEMESTLKSNIPLADVIFLGGWCLPPRVKADSLVEIINKWKKDGVSVALDMVWNEDTWEDIDSLMKVLCSVDILFLNEMEAKRLFSEPDLDKAVKMLNKKLLTNNEDNRIILLKLGSSGSRVLKAGLDAHIDTYPAVGINTVGAGDMFDISFLHARFVLGMELIESARFAVMFASMAISTRHMSKKLPASDDVLNALKA